MNQEADAKDTALSLVLMPFILGGGLLALVLLVAFADALHVSPKLMVFLAAVGLLFPYGVYRNETRREKQVNFNVPKITPCNDNEVGLISNLFYSPKKWSI